MKKVILHLCADTGSDTYPYQEDTDNYEVVLVGSRVGVENFSIANWLYFHPQYTQVYGIIANPPCLEFSTARYGGKSRNHDEGMILVRQCQRIIEEAKALGGLKFWVIENPATGRLKEYLGKPTLTYQPYQYGSPWTKKTALWGEFNAPPKKYTTFDEVPNHNPSLWIKKGRTKPSLAHQHKSAVFKIDEFAAFAYEIDSDMEFRSLCSQKFAKAFKEVNS